MNLRACFAIAISLGIAHPFYAQPLNGARITHVSKDVRLRTGGTGTEQASLGEILGAGVTVDNGAKARTELTFGNRSIVRLGANTILHLKDDSGAIDLAEGAILFRVPKGSNGQITSGAIRVTSKGATGLLERNHDLYTKLLLLEGGVRVSLPDQVGESILMEPGQILIASSKATRLPEAAYFDITRSIRTCRLLSDFPPLPGQDSLANEARKQARLTSNGDYIPSNLVIFGRGTLVNLVSSESFDKNRPTQTSNSQSPH